MILRYKHLECARTMCWPVHTRNRDNIYLCCGNLLRIAYENKMVGKCWAHLNKGLLVKLRYFEHQLCLMASSPSSESFGYERSRLLFSLRENKNIMSKVNSNDSSSNASINRAYIFRAVVLCCRICLWIHVWIEWKLCIPRQLWARTETLKSKREM